MCKLGKIQDYFEKIYIINLPERQDRRNEMAEQLTKIGLSINHPIIYLFPAVRPLSADEFPTIGTKGCFLSHLGVLEDAVANQYSRILILEDDLNFSDNFNNMIAKTLEKVSKLDWDILYFSHKLPEPNSTEQIVLEIPPDQSLTTTHFLAFQGATIAKLTGYLELMLNRKSGDSLGGPMHVDGAYSWFRTQYTEYKTYVCLPVLGYQRASRTDIHQLSWLDSTPLVKKLSLAYVKLKILFTNF